MTTGRLITWPLVTCVVLLVHVVLAHSQQPAGATPRAISEEEIATWRADAERVLESSDSRLGMRVTWVLEELWKQGWPAKVASAHRTLAAQRESFEAGHSRTLRSKHLCGKAADFSLYPHDYPDVDHAFWDAKDALAHTQKLRTLDAPSFRDRPHVELDEDCDWDEVELGPVGIWRSKRVTLVITKDDRGRYTGTLTTPKGKYLVDRLVVRHMHSGERGKFEDAEIEVEFEGAKGKRHTNTYEVSTITSDAHGYRRADWRWLERDGVRLTRSDK